MRWKNLVLVFIGFLIIQPGFAQKKGIDLTLNGYAKDLRTFYPFNGLDSLVIDNLIHNRLNLNWYINDDLTLKFGNRNRVFYGEMIRANPFFARQIAVATDDVFVLSNTWVKGRSFVAHSTLDRAYAEYVKGDWEIRAGRQRINWGINTFGNPNDIFNAFSFFDFDYAERPGSDALRVTRYTGATSSVEVAVKGFSSTDRMVAGGLWKFGKWKYDFQLLGGWYYTDAVIGGGWVGNIKDIGFKGEASYFQPMNGDSSLSETLSASIGFDYSWEKGTFLAVAYFYSSAGATSSNILSLLAIRATPKQIFPFRHSGIVSLMYPVNNRLNAGLTSIYTPAGNMVILNPTLGYSLSEEMNLDLFAFHTIASGLPANSAATVFFTRLMYSF